MLPKLCSSSPRDPQVSSVPLKHATQLSDEASNAFTDDIYWTNDVTDGWDGCHIRLASILRSLGGTEKYQVLFAFASNCGCLQHVKASPVGDKSSVPLMF